MKMMTMKEKVVYIHSAGTIVYRTKNNIKEFLLIQGKRKNVWGFPKGHVEKGENVKDTAIRETREEAGINVQLCEGFKHDMHYNPAKNARKTVTFYIATTKDTNVRIQKEEIIDYAWLEYDKAMKRLSFENSRNTLRLAKKYLEKRNL